MDDSDQPARPLFTFGPGMRAMLLVALCFSCIGIYEMLAKSSQLEWLSPSPEKGDSVQSAWLISILQAFFIFALPALIYANVFPMERFGYFRLNKSVAPIKILFGSLVLVLLVFPMDMGATWLKNSLTNKELIDYINANEKYSHWFYQMPTFGSFLFCLFANAFVPAFCEELLFRGGIQQILMERSRIKHISIVITALIFTFFHANLVGIPFIFIAGLILGYAFYRTGSLRITIIMHFLFNAISLFIDYLGQHNSAIKNWNPGIAGNIIFVIGSGLFFFLFWKKTHDQPADF